MSYGKFIESARSRAGLSQADFAARIGRTQAVVSAWETDRYDPKPADFVRMADEAGATLDELMRGERRLEAPGGDEATLLRIVRSLGLDFEEAVRRLCAAPESPQYRKGTGFLGGEIAVPERSPAGNHSGEKPKGQG